MSDDALLTYWLQYAFEGRTLVGSVAAPAYLPRALVEQAVAAVLREQYGRAWPRVHDVRLWAHGYAHGVITGAVNQLD